MHLRLHPRGVAGRNHVSDGIRERFLAANDEFRYNCLILADLVYPWWSWRRYRARLVAQILYDFVSADGFGWKAWLEAHERHLKRTENQKEQSNA